MFIILVLVSLLLFNSKIYIYNTLYRKAFKNDHPPAPKKLIKPLEFSAKNHFGTLTPLTALRGR